MLLGLANQVLVRLRHNLFAFCPRLTRKSILIRSATIRFFANVIETSNGSGPSKIPAFRGKNSFRRPCSVRLSAGIPWPESRTFSMVAAMMCRIHQSGRLDSLTPGAAAQVTEGSRIYKKVLRKQIPSAVPFCTVGTSDVTNREAPVALGMRSPEQTLIPVWRIDGRAVTRIPNMGSVNPRLVYPTDLGIHVASTDGAIRIKFPRPHMACVVSA